MQLASHNSRNVASKVAQSVHQGTSYYNFQEIGSSYWNASFQRPRVMYSSWGVNEPFFTLDFPGLVEDVLLSMKTNMSNLPMELEEEIISRLPLKSLRAVRLTCKKWNALLKSRSFGKMHIGNLEARELDESRMIVMRDHNVHLMSVFVDENPSTKLLGELTCLNNKKQIEISKVFHCDGLLLCVLKDDNSRVVVWNPYLGQTRVIKTTYNSERDKYKYGIGYEEKSKSRRRSYKILRFMDVWSSSQVCEIYNFDSNSWTNHNLSSPSRIQIYDRGVSLKGNTYWCATNKHGGFIRSTVCFDFTRMRFGGVQYLPFRVTGHPCVTLSCVGDEKLSVLAQCIQTFVIDIWITNKIEEHKVLWGKDLKVKDKASKVYWSKFLTIDSGPLTDFWISDGCFFLEEEKKTATVVNKDRHKRSDAVKIFGEDRYSKEVNLGEPSDIWCWPLVCPYVPSLVQIKLPKGGKRKRQRNLEEG